LQEKIEFANKMYTCTSKKPVNVIWKKMQVDVSAKCDWKVM